MKRIALIVAITTATAACGGSGHAALYASGPSKACLVDKHVRVGNVTSATDFIASTAPGGSFRATLPQNSVTVSFGETLDEANNIDQAYRGASAPNVGIDDVLHQKLNAVMLWHLHPSANDIATITGCLKS